MPLPGDESKAKLIADPGLSYPSAYIIRTATWLQRFHVLPEPGGLNAQDKQWVEDMELYFGMKAQVLGEYLDWKKANSPP